MDNIHMNDEELNKLAKKIADIVVRKLNSQFDFNPTNEEPVDDVVFINEFLAGRLSFQEDVEEKLVAELARLTTLLTIYEDKEEYEKAAIIQNKITRINNQLNNL